MKEVLCSGQAFSLEFPYPGGSAALHWNPMGDHGELTASLCYDGAYGMGEKYNAVNQKGRTAVNEVEEKFCFQGEKTYCPAPFFWTNTGFGLYAATDERTSFRFGENEIRAELPANCRLILFAGAPGEIIRDYMALFGPAKVPPKWAFGPWISANHWDSQEKVERAAAQAEEHGFPVCALVAEAWSDEATFYIFRGARYTPRPDGGTFRLEDFDFSDSPWPDPAGMVRRLHEKGIHFLLWQIPVYKKQGQDEPLNAQNELDWADAAARGLCVRNADGSPYTIPEGHWFAGSMIPDFSNPAAEETWFAKRQYLTELGVDGFKTDGGEFIYRDDVRFADGSSGRAGKNRYAQQYTAAYTRHLAPEQALFSRAGYAGQHTTPIHWAGDQQSQNSELASALRAGLSAALTGIPFWSFDIGGFAGPLPSLDLYRRATQLACFVPVMQWHSEPDGGQFRELMPGGEGNNERSPWNLAAAYGVPEFVDEMRFWHNLRMNLLPYLYSTALDCAEASIPMMRPLVYQWPEDPLAWDCEDEFLLGDSLLVAPLLEENTGKRTVYLPEGQWIGLFDRRAAAGGQAVTAGGDGRLPVFLRAGSGLALRLDESRSLGSPVGNRAAAGAPLHLLLAGTCGQFRFRDELGTDLTITWTGGEPHINGSCPFPLTWEVIPAEGC